MRNPKRVLALIAFSAVTAALVWLGIPAVQNWRQQRCLQTARSCFAKEDYKGAALSASKALQINPMNAAASSFMAEMSEKLGDATAVLWRRRAVEAQPDNLEFHAQLARTALRFRDIKEAQAGLKKVAGSEEFALQYHKIAASLAAGTNNLQAARIHFSEVLSLDPGNLDAQLHLAIIDLQNADAVLARNAHALLGKLKENVAARDQALMALMAHALSRGDLDSALSSSRERAGTDGAILEARLQHLSLLHAARTPDFESEFLAVRDSVNTPDKILIFSIWGIQHGLASNILVWLRSFPDNLMTALPVSMALADTLLALENWSNLQFLLKDQTWEGAEWIRHALLSRAMREQKLEDSSRVSWRAALQNSSGNLAALSALLRLSLAWEWDVETAEVLAIICDQFPNQHWALDFFRDFHLAKASDTQSLNKIFALMMERDPHDLAAKNNFALTCLLLGNKEKLAHQLAGEVHAHQPENAYFASTHAFSLHLRGRTEEALKIMNSIRQEDLETPGIAAYHGILLAASGDPERARKYLTLAEGAPTLLPEERKLLNQAKSPR